MTEWTAELVCERLIEAYRYLLRTPVRVEASHIEPVGLALGRTRAEALEPLEWAERYLGKGSEEYRFIIRHTKWIVEGNHIRVLVEAGAPVWERRKMSWSSYKRKRSEICERIASGLVYDEVAAQLPRIRIVAGMGKP
jgi:hypothetical protein